jgi:hypothetical protein
VSLTSAPRPVLPRDTDAGRRQVSALHPLVFRPVLRSVVMSLLNEELARAQHQHRREIVVDEQRRALARRISRARRLQRRAERAALQARLILASL